MGLVLSGPSQHDHLAGVLPSPRRGICFPQHEVPITSCAASTMCPPLAVLQPAASAAWRNAVTPCPAITSPTNIDDLSSASAYSPQGAAHRWLVAVCLASVAAMSSDLPHVRASHEDRDRVVDVLRVAGGDGRLSAEELDARLESALT